MRVDPIIPPPPQQVEEALMRKAAGGAGSKLLKEEVTEADIAEIISKWTGEREGKVAHPAACRPFPCLNTAGLPCLSPYSYRLPACHASL